MMHAHSFLAADPEPPGVMARAPRPRNAAFLTAGVAMGVYLYGLKYHDEATARTHAFTALVFAELLRSFGARSNTVPVWRMNWRGSAWLFLVVGASFALQLWSHHNHTLASVMKTVPVEWNQCIPLIAVSFIPLAVLELVKVLRTQRKERA